MGRLIITGTGPVSPSGTENSQFWKSVLEPAGETGGPVAFSETTAGAGGTIGEFNADAYIDGRKFRRAAGISKVAMSAAGIAVSDAGISSLSGSDSALVVAVTHGAINYTQSYNRSLVLGGVEDISPILFSDSVLNAPAGNGSLCFDIRGAVHTVPGDITAAIKALTLACRMIRAGSVKRALVVSAEELNELSFFCRSKLGERALSEGAGAILIEDEDHGEGRTPYCRISGYASYFDHAGPDHSIVTAAERALAMAGITREQVDYALADTSSEAGMAFLEGIPTGSVVRHTGNAFNVTAAWNMILAALIIGNGVVPGPIFGDKAVKNPAGAEHILICNSDITGPASAVVLSRHH